MDHALIEATAQPSFRFDERTGEVYRADDVHAWVERLARGQDAARAIRSAVESLAAHPLIGRRVHGDIRELVISFGQTGCIAL